MLLTAMLFAIGIALVLGSYLALSRTTLKLAHRSYFANDASNLAEAGLEEALYCFNQMAAGTAPATAWSGWTLSGADAKLTLPTFNRDQNGIGIVKVYVIGYDGSNATPTVLSQATITPFDGGAPVIKTVQMALKNNGAPIYGLVALHGLNFKGSNFADSFNSNPTNSPTGPWAAYSSAVAASKTSVVVLAGSVKVGSGKIYGDLKLGAPVATPPASDYTGTVTTNFTATFPMPVYPTAAAVSQSYNVSSTIPPALPRGGDLPAADGRYYYFCKNTTIGSVAIANGMNVTIVGTGTKLSAGLNILGTGTCFIYMDGVVTLSKGADLVNTGWAGALQIYTTTTGNCSIGNNSQIMACLYAPNADLTVSGSGSSGMLIGSFVADTITASNTMDFHFDEALRPFGSGWRLTGWLELQSAADRATVAGRTGNFLR